MYHARLNGVSCLFTEDRAETPTAPEKYPFRYDLRHGEESFYPVTIERGVIANFCGVVYSPVLLLDEGEEYRRVRGFTILSHC